MGKMAYALLLAFIIQFSLILFTNSEIPGSAIYNFLISPFNWNSSPFVDALNAILILSATVGGIIAGLYFVRNEWIVYAALGAVMLSFGVITYNFWQFLNSQSIFGDANPIIATIVVAPIIIFYIFSVLDFTRGSG